MNFPINGHLSGYSIKSGMGDSICDENTYSIHLKNGGKFTFTGHRRFLQKNHPYRRQTKAFNGEVENRTTPHPLNREQVFQKVKELNIQFGKKSVNKTLSEPWKKVSIFF